MKYRTPYQLHQKIGTGRFSTFYRATPNQGKKQQVAIKVVKISVLQERTALESVIVNEINTLNSIGAHTNIMAYYDMLKTPNNFYFVYQYCDQGSLENILKSGNKLSESQAFKILKEILNALQHLNKFNMTHLNVEPRHIYLHKGIAKLGGFGFDLPQYLEGKAQREYHGLPQANYKAPQVLNKQLQNCSKADIWSLGVILYEMLFGRAPYYSNTKEVPLYPQIQFFSKEVAQPVCHLITRMLQKDITSRISWDELRHAVLILSKEEDPEINPIVRSLKLVELREKKPAKEQKL